MLLVPQLLVLTMSFANKISWSHNDFLQGSEHRLSSWKNLRQELQADLENQAWIQKVVDFWSLAPLQSRVLDYSQSATWPGPWQLMHAGDFDENAVSLGMFYTCALSQDRRWQSQGLELLLLKDYKNHREQLAVCIEKTWLIGWEYKTIKSWQTLGNQVMLQHCWRWDLDTYLAVSV